MLDVADDSSEAARVALFTQDLKYCQPFMAFAIAHDVQNDRKDIIELHLIAYNHCNLQPWHVVAVK
jgi:hypothetical protein